MIDGSAPPDRPPELKERLLLAMKRAGLNQVELARRLHTDPRVLRRYLSGERTPSPEVLRAWEVACEVPPGSLSPSTSDGVTRDTASGPVRARRFPPLRMALVAGLIVAVLAGGAAWSASRTDRAPQRADRPDAVQCPAPTGGTAFMGRTFKDGVVVRDGAGQDFPLRVRLAGDCDLGFSGYCVGQTVADVFTGTVDSRWFIIKSPGRLNGGLVASGVVKGDTPPGSSPVGCPGSRAIPQHVEVQAAPDPGGTGQLRLLAVVAGADVVGFAALLPVAGSSDPPRWQQIGFEQDANKGFSVLIGPPGAKAAFPPGEVAVTSVVCLATGAPTTTQAVVVVRSGADGTPSVVPGVASPDPGPDGRQAACRYPTSPPPSATTTTVP